mmetsp:Transcript_13843/g.43327  ORF Transcript_13843/g.43327 Transcript_13843/m.43327 type:complete len:319 (-) Transcript_13843:122-1078(-)
MRRFFGLKTEYERAGARNCLAGHMHLPLAVPSVSFSSRGLASSVPLSARSALRKAWLKSKRNATTREAMLSMPSFASFLSAATRSPGPHVGCEAQSTSKSNRRSWSTGPPCGPLMSKDSAVTCSSLAVWGCPSAWGKVLMSKTMGKRGQSTASQEPSQLSAGSTESGVPISNECRSFEGVLETSTKRPELLLLSASSCGPLRTEEGVPGLGPLGVSNLSPSASMRSALVTEAADPFANDHALVPPSDSPTESTSESLPVSSKEQGSWEAALAGAEATGPAAAEPDTSAQSAGSKGGHSAGLSEPLSHSASSKSLLPLL